MNSRPLWQLIVHKRALKIVGRAPRPERERVLRALEDMRFDPFAGDVRPLQGHPTAFRRRVGDWRILFDASPERRVIEVAALARRSTTTDRKR